MRRLQSISDRMAGICGKVKTIALSHKVMLSAAVVAIILPPLLDLIYIKLFGVNVVNYDQWEFVPLIEKMYTGTLGLADLFAQHNEHRIFFPRIVMLALAYVTKYNVLAEMYSSWVIMIGTLALIFRMYLKKAGKSVYSILAFIPVVWLLFSYRQYENLLWGWQIQVFMCVFGLIASVYLMEGTEKINARFIGAAFFAVFSSFSFINGLLVWPVNLALILLTRGGKKIQMSVVWAIMGCATGALYFYHWVDPSNNPSTMYMFSHAADAVEYFFINVGAPLMFEKGGAFSVGIVLLLLLAAVAVLLVKYQALRENAVWACLILFSLATSAACVVGRSGLGVEQALTSRYTTLTVFSVIGLYIIVLNFLKKYKDRPEGMYFAMLFGAVLCLVVVGIMVGYSGGIYSAPGMKDNNTQAIGIILNYNSENNTVLSQIYPLPDHVRTGAEILQKYKLNVFADR